MLGADDFALLRRHRYGTVLIDAATHERVDVLPDRRPDTLEAWLREHPGVEIVMRDGSTTYAEAICRATPTAIQVADRRHLRHNLARAAEKVVAAHARCRLPPARNADSWPAKPPPSPAGTPSTTSSTVVRLLDCARRLGFSLNTVKRYSRISEPEKLRRPPQ